MATSINDPFKSTSSGIVDPFRPAPAPAPAPAGPTAAQTLGGLARDLGGSAINVGGGMLESAAQVVRPIGRNIGAPSLDSAADALSGAGRSVSDYGRGLQEGASNEYRNLVAGTQIGGEVHQPSTWTLGPDPSLTGAASLLAQGLGSTAPTLATGYLTKGRMLPSAAAAAAAGGGVAAQSERERLLGLDAAALAEIPGYNARIAAGFTPEQARVGLAEDAAASAFRHTAPVSAADVFTQVLPFTKGAQQALAKAVGPGRLARTAAGFVGGGLGEAAQETGENAAQRLGANVVTGENRPLLEDSLNDALVGFATGGLLSGAGAVTTSPRQAAAELEAMGAPGRPTVEPPVETLPPQPVPVDVEQTVVDPAAGPLSRIVATEAARDLGSPVVTPVAVTTPLADEQALAAQADQQQAFDKDQQRKATKEAAAAERAAQRGAANDDAPAGDQPDGVPVMITLAMRRDLAAMGYTGPQIAQLRPAEAWNILQSAGAESATPSPAAPAAASTEETTDGSTERGAGTGQPASDAAAPEGTGAGQESAPAARQEEGQGQGQAEGQEVQEHPAGQGGRVDPTPEPLDGDIAPPSSDRFTIRDAAQRVADRTPGSEVIELSDGGFVVRTPTESTPDEPETTDSAAAVEPAGADAGADVPAALGEPGAGEVPAAADTGTDAVVPPTPESGDAGAVSGDAVGESPAVGGAGSADVRDPVGAAGDAVPAGADAAAAGAGDAGATVSDATDTGGMGGSVGDGDGESLPEGLTGAPAGGTTGDGATGIGGTGTATESKPKRLPRFRKTDDLTNDLRERARAGTLESEEATPLLAELERRLGEAGMDALNRELDALENGRDPNADAPTQSELDAADAERRHVKQAGKVGQKLAEGETATTSSGRTTTPFPKVDWGSERKSQNTIKRAERWLMENALAEAESRGDEFNARWMRQALDNPSQADKDSAEEYLFGEQPAVLPPFLKPLTGGGETATETDEPTATSEPTATADTTQEPPSGTDQEPADREAAEAGEPSSEPSGTSGEGSEPAADPTDPTAPRAPKESAEAETTTETGQSDENQPDRSKSDDSSGESAGRPELLQDAGEELIGARSWRNKLRDLRTNDRAKDAAKLIDTASRVDALQVRLAEDATPGASRVLDALRNSFETFTEFARDALGMWRSDTPRQSLIDELANSQEQYDKGEALVAQYMADLGAVASVLDGAADVQGVVDRLRAALLDTTTEDGKTKVEWTELGKTASLYMRNTYGPRSMSQRLDWWVSDFKAGEASESVRTKPLTRPKLEGVEREGLPARREGDVTAEDLVSTFGFRGVNYGDYVNAKERQLHTNHAFDALHDLAEVMGLPPKAMSLGGTLGLSIGKEGSGKAAAHFEPGTKIINITKGRGDGSLAHEWGHAFSDYIRDHLTSTNRRSTADTLRTHLSDTVSLDALKGVVDNLLAGKSYIKGQRRAGPVGAAEAVLEGRYWKNRSWGVIKQTQFKADGDELGKSYWGSEEEMWARAFESWVFDRLEGSSPYLASGWIADGATSKQTGYRGRPYPTGDERLALAADFDAIKAALRSDESGLLTLDSSYQTPNQRQVKAVIEWSNWALANIDTLYARAVGGHPSAGGLFWYSSSNGRDTGTVPRGYHAYIDGSSSRAWVGYPEPLTAAQVESFKLKAATVHPDSEGIVTTQTMPNAGGYDPLVERLFRDIQSARMPADNIALRKIVAELDGGPVDGARMKQAQEALELAIVRRARELMVLMDGDRATFKELLALYESQPNLNVRTSTSVQNQAYSTPAPLAFLASRLAGIDYTTKVYEPTAGNGMLLIGAAPANITANELNEERHAALLAQGIDAAQGDALEAVGTVVQPGTQDVVISNPPFDNLRDANGKAEKREFDGYKIGKLDHLIVADALRTMKGDGKATLIIGANMQEGAITTDDRIFFNWLYSTYNVTGHFEVDGKLYARQGASWPVRVITIHGRVSSNRVTPQPGEITRVDNWNDVYERFNEVLGAQDRPLERHDDPSGGPRDSTGRGAGRGGLPFADGREGGATGGSSRTGSGSSGTGSQSGAATGATGDSGQPAGGDVAAGADGQRPDDRTGAQDQLEPGDHRDSADAADAGRDQKRAPRANATRPDRDVLTDPENAFQAPYQTRSSRADTGVLVPVNMAQPLQDALSRLEDAVGDIDEYAMRELGYKSVDALHDAFMGLQVDSVASAIYQNKVRGKGIVIADQTGIGKGRQAAAMIRWALKQGMTPVFVTVKPSLFTDMYGDLADIGSTDVKPLILNKDEWISGKDGKRLFVNKAATHTKTMREIASSGELPKGSNAMFMTYSQINKPNVQREVLSALAPNAFFILDESHNAGGESQTGEFVRGLLGPAKGVVYLSATYAKRPDNMPVYFRTDISDAIEGGSEALVNAMKEGGIPLQTVVANGLVESGQMFRRERSYDGVSIETVVDTSARTEHERLSDRVTLALRAIVDADREFHTGYVAFEKAKAAAKGEDVSGGGNQAAESVSHSEFSSVVHNFVKQMLLGLKADNAAERAIAEIKAGRKPLIALENTMGSFLNQYASDNALSQGDLLGSFDYRTVLSRALERTRFITRKDQKGNDVREHISLSQLDPNTRRLYQQAQETINGLEDIADLPVSPLDWIRHRITQAGYSVAEITGRDLAVDYTGEAPKLSRVPTEEQTDKVLTTKKFNDGRLDAIILNVSGSTGISLHASEKFKDRRPRHMIVAQPASDINIFMQMLGRVHRTGQVELPSYSILNVDLPAEKRPTAVLNRKMQSLNANTSSNAESATSIKSSDLLNKYGDQIVNQYLWENPELAKALGVDAKDPDGESGVEEDIARKATGRLALMPVETQLSFYAEVEGQYESLIDFLNKTGQNDLVPRTLDYDAELVEEQVIVEATNPSSPFGGEAIYGEYRVKAQGKAMTPDEIRAQMAEHLGNHLTEDDKRTDNMQRAGGRHADELIAKLEALLPKRERDPNQPIGQPPPDEVVTGAGRQFLRGHPIGSMWRVEIGGDPYNAVVVDVRNTHKGAGNPFSLSKIQVVLALNGPLRSVVVPASQWGKIEISGIYGYGISLDGAFREQAEGTTKAKIITGNLLGAYGEIRGTSSQIISFTKKDGTTAQGILLPKKFDLERNTHGDYHFRTPEAVMTFLSQSKNPEVDRFGIASRDQTIRVQMNHAGDLVLSTPKSKARGGKYFLNKKLLEHTGDFVSSGDAMKATVPKAKSAAALEAVMSNTALYAMPSMAEEARAILSQPRSAQSRPDPARPAGGYTDTTALDHRVRQAVGRWTGDVPTVRVVTLAEELPAAAKREKGWASVEGWYDGVRTIYLVAGNIPNTTRGMQVLAHEAIGHYGVEAVLGKADWTRVVGDVAKLRRRRDSLPADMQAAMDSAVRRYGGDNAATFAREFIAIMAERDVKSSLMGRVLAAVRRWLRAMGLPVDVWAAAELRQIVAEGAAQVRKRARQRQTGDRRGSAASDRPGAFYSALTEAVEKAQGAPKKAVAQVWRGWMDGAQRRGEFKQAERDWLGVDAWLEGQTGPITREQIADFVRANQVRIEEVKLGGDDVEGFDADSIDLTVNDQRTTDDGDTEYDYEDEATGEQFTVLVDEDVGNVYVQTYKGDSVKIDAPMNRQTLADAERAMHDFIVEKHGPKAAEGTQGPTEFATYQLPGGENYRELLLTLPSPPPTYGVNLSARQRPDGNWEVIRRDGEIVKAFRTKIEADRYVVDNGMRFENQPDKFRGTHWKEPNVLAHVRYNERTDADGKRVLFIEEIQSDWHQKGRRDGYKRGTPGEAFTKDTTFGPSYGIRWPDGREQMGFTSLEVAQERAARGEPTGVPDAPFKGTDEWAMLAFKRMVRHAAENGFERIAWTTGDQQAERYDLSKQVSMIRVVPGAAQSAIPVGQRYVQIHMNNASYGFTLRVDKDGVVAEGGGSAARFTGSRLDEIIGKEMAEKIMAAEKETAFDGDKLRIGGDGMRGFYDNILPKAVNKWAKKLGGKVGELYLDPKNPLTVGVQNTGVGELAALGGSPVHSLDLTDTMREFALAGQPLFSRPEPGFEVRDTRGRVLGSAATELEAQRLASRLRRDGKRVGSVEPASAGNGLDPILVQRTDPSNGSTFDELSQTRAALDAAQETGNLSQLLDAVAAQADADPKIGDDFAWLARKLSPMAKALGVKLIQPRSGANIGGAYDIGKNAVWIRQALPSTILHESLHAVTSALMTSKSARTNEAVRKAVAEFNDLLAAAQAHAASIDMASLPAALRRTLENKNGPLSNIKELLTYGMTDRRFQIWLDSIPAPTAREPRSAWQWFKDAVGRLMTMRGERLTGNPATLLGAVIESTSDLVDFAEANPAAVRIARFSEAARLTGADPAAITSVMDIADRATGRPRHAIPGRFDAEQQAVAEKFVTFQHREKLTARVERLKDQAGKRMVQRVFDQFRPLRDLDETAFMQAHMSKATDGALEAAFEYGIPAIRQGAFDIAERTGGFKKVLSNLNGEHDQFLMWVVGHRAEALRAEGREHLFSPQDIAAMQRLNEGTMADGSSRKDAYSTALREFNRYNKAMLDIGEKAGVINKEGRKIWESGFYIPFFREMERDPSNGPGQIKGLLRQKVIERLVGGREPLGDPLENILANWSHILTASMKNMAAQNAMKAAVKAEIAEPVKGAQKGAVWVMENGVETYYVVHDPFVLEALESMSFNGYDNPVMRAAGAFKRMLTTTVTISPSFRIRNLARDVASALATAEVGYNPVANMWNGMKLQSMDDEGVALLAGGGRIRFGTINDGAQAQHAKRLIEAGVPNKNILDTRSKMASAMRKAYDWWQDVGDKAETVNRAVIYDRAIKAGKSHLQASFEARDLMNFTSMGSSAIIRALSQVLPFFNARLQGMDRLGRGALKNPTRFAAVTGTLALASAALFLLQADDDDYRALPDYVRDTYWPIKIGGHFYYVPKPFEVGAMATVVERATELAVAGDDYRAKDFGQTILEIAMSQLAMNPIPQAVRPVTEAAFNYDLFRMAPIDTLGQQNLLPEDRYTARTRAGAVAAGKLTGMSPQRLEHMVRGYFGWIGIQALNVSDYLLRDAIGMPAGTHQDLSRPSNLFVVGDFMKEPSSISNKYLTRFYEEQGKIDRIYASVNLARRTGDAGRLESLLGSPELKNRPIYQAADKQMTKINQQIRAVTAHPTMTAAEKNRQLTLLNQQRNALAMKVDRAVRGRE